MLRLQDVIAALVVIRIMVQFLMQVFGLLLLRARRPDFPVLSACIFIRFRRCWRRWASFTFFIARPNLKEIRFGAVIAVLGVDHFPGALLAAQGMAIFRAARSRSCRESSPMICHVRKSRRGPLDPWRVRLQVQLAPVHHSALSPLREPLFRSLWIAAVISYTGSWMQNVATGWLMTSLTSSPMWVALVQVAVSLPVLLIALPAGALADIVDRRKFLALHPKLHGGSGERAWRYDPHADRSLRKFCWCLLFCWAWAL